MVAIANHNELVQNYFRAWYEFNIQLLIKIFSGNVKYIIFPLNRILCGHSDIVEYWKRNEKRQLDLELDWRIIKATDRRIVIEFTASFYDTEENENQLIDGIIYILLDENWRFQLLFEDYTKTIIGS